jgi:hypothetical protein
VQIITRRGAYDPSFCGTGAAHGGSALLQHRRRPQRWS